jgi:hypothetical protein
MYSKLILESTQMRNRILLVGMVAVLAAVVPASAEFSQNMNAFLSATRMEPGTVVAFGPTWVRNFTIDAVTPNPVMGSGATFNSFFDIFTELSIDSGLTWNPVSGSGNISVTPALRGNISGIETWSSSVNDMTATTGSGVMFRESPTLSSTGTNTYKPVSNGYMIDSFFDVFLEMSTNGGETWQPVTGVSQNSGQTWTVGVYPAPIGVVNDTPVVVQTAVNLFQPRIGAGRTATVNDFHVRFRVNRWEKNGYTTFLGGPMNKNYLNPLGYVGPGAVVATDQEGDFIEITWTFPTMQISDLSMPWFGFTFGNGPYRIRNGFRYQVVEWYWTLNGVRVTEYDNDLDVWQDWIKVWNPVMCRWELQDVVVNRNTVPRTVALTAGTQMSPTSPLTIAAVAAGGATPPNAVATPPNPVLPGGTVVTPWPWPGTDPDYYMYYEVADGVTPGASFRNAVELVAEPATACPTADVTGDCFVNFRDFAVMTSQWLTGVL